MSNILWLERIKQHWQTSLLVLFLLPLLSKLGLWQLDRADEKRQLLAVYQQQENIPARPLSSIIGGTLSPYQKVIVKGVFDKEKYWLLDNKNREGQVGYEVLMPLITDSQTLLVNRGWVKALPLREQLPTFTTPEVPVSIEGYVAKPSKNPLINHGKSDLSLLWPKRVLSLDLAQAETALGKPLLPWVVRINDESPGAFVTQWPVISTKPEKHRGYALQWFSMALVLLVLYGVVLAKGRDHDKKNQ